ncbi:MAG: helix-turn-helix domain-containing protein [Deltaproteobacteria bacterium]|nr:helix-turn-helix domain-containing protein [Deltaproteobacteria bacterium]
MKSLDEQNHYDILEISRDAAPEEVERAYRIAKAAYAEESLALYSLFDTADAAVIRDRIECAYEVLCSFEARSAYDDEVPADELSERDPDVRPSSVRRSTLSVESMTALAFDSDREAAPPSATVAELPAAIDVFEDLHAEVEEEEQDFDGAGLRRARMRRGIELEQIAAVTKVSRTCLQHIEDERYGELPAAVYVRGFVSAYARAIGLDTKRVATGYMARLEESRDAPRRSGLLGRK